jgi:hypothetical protein
MSAMLQQERMFRSEVFVVGGVQLVDWREEGKNEQEENGKNGHESGRLVLERLAEGLKEVKEWSKVHLEMGNFYNKEVEYLR